MSRRSLLLLTIGLVAGCSSPRQVEEQGNAELSNCTGCHGDPQNLNPAPPVSAHGATATTDVTVGAHQAHLHDSPLRRAIPCSECHVVPATVSDPTHIDMATATVTWGPLATTGGKTQPYARSADGTTANCTVYCHGASFTVSNGSNHSPSWTRVDSTQASCGTCHGIPPPPPHPAAGSIVACSGCHPETVKPDGTIDVAGGKHIDGIVEIIGGGSCTACHGDATRTDQAVAPAPPRDTHGNVATTAPGVGAHQAHLTAGTLAPPFPCTECHVVPSDLAHAAQQLQLTWGPIATAGGVRPTFDPATTTCANYCHGANLASGSNNRPVWTAGSSQVACGTCHGVPPQSGLHGGVHAGIPCGTCHGNGYSATTVDRARHVNGVADVGGPGSAITSWQKPNCAPLCHTPRTWTD